MSAYRRRVEAPRFNWPYFGVLSLTCFLALWGAVMLMLSAMSIVGLFYIGTTVTAAIISIFCATIASLCGNKPEEKRLRYAIGEGIGYGLWVFLPLGLATFGAKVAFGAAIGGVFASLTFPAVFLLAGIGGGFGAFVMFNPTPEKEKAQPAEQVNQMSLSPLPERRSLRESSPVERAPRKTYGSTDQRIEKIEPDELPTIERSSINRGP